MALFTWVLWKNLNNRRGIICFSICARGQTKRSSFQTYVFSQGRVLCCWPRWQLKFTHTLKWTLTSESPKKRITDTSSSHKTMKEVLCIQKSVSHCWLSHFWSVCAWTEEWKLFNNRKILRNWMRKGPKW